MLVLVFGPLLGSCSGQCANVDGPDPLSFLSQPGAWFRVESIRLGNGHDPSLERTEDFVGRYVVEGGDDSITRNLPASVDTLRMHGSIARAISASIKSKAEVFAHSGDLGPAFVSYAVAFDRDDFAFLGHCQNEILTAWVKRQFGERARQVTRDLVGKRSDAVEGLLREAMPGRGASNIGPERSVTWAFPGHNTTATNPR